MCACQGFLHVGNFSSVLIKLLNRLHKMCSYKWCTFPGSVMFLLTMFLMGGPQSQQKQDKPQDMGHENAGFTLEKISEMNGTANRQAVESSRLWENVRLNVCVSQCRAVCLCSMATDLCCKCLHHFQVTVSGITVFDLCWKEVPLDNYYDYSIRLFCQNFPSS